MLSKQYKPHEWVVSHIISFSHCRWLGWNNPQPTFSFDFLMMLGIEPRVSGTLGKCRPLPVQAFKLKKKSYSTCLSFWIWSCVNVLSSDLCRRTFLSIRNSQIYLRNLPVAQNPLISWSWPYTQDENTIMYFLCCLWLLDLFPMLYSMSWLSDILQSSRRSGGVIDSKGPRLQACAQSRTRWATPGRY